MATETETQTAGTESKRAQLNKEKREDKNKSRVPEGQMAGGGANLAFDNGMSANKEKGDKGENSNSSGKESAGNKGESNGSEDMNFGQVMAQEKKKQKKKAEKKKKKSATYQGSKQALRMSWRALIPSWFLSIFAIDTFAFLHVVLPKFICSLGEEWGSPMTAAVSGKKGLSNKSLVMKTLEPLLVILINLFVLVAIFITIVALMVALAITNPWILGWASMAELWDLIKSAFGG